MPKGLQQALWPTWKGIYICYHSQHCLKPGTGCTSRIHHPEWHAQVLTTHLTVESELGNEMKNTWINRRTREYLFCPHFGESKLLLWEDLAVKVGSTGHKSSENTHLTKAMAYHWQSQAVHCKWKLHDDRVGTGCRSPYGQLLIGSLF